MGENKKPREEGVDTSEPEFQIVLASVHVSFALLVWFSSKIRDRNVPFSIRYICVSKNSLTTTKVEILYQGPKALGL